MLIRGLDEFSKERNPDQSLSALLVANPGSGKSYLASRLANKLDMPILNFNITQLVKREELISCFDVIASTQAQKRGSRLLIFFDEINALISGTHVYDLFLSVLEGGTYSRDGQLFKLEPCAWLFAGTEELLPHAKAKRLMKEKSERYAHYISSKAPDLYSRLTIKSVKLDGTEDQNNAESEIRRGFVYQGALQLQNRHSDIKRISLDVLLAFYFLDIKTSVRKITHYTNHFRDIQYGVVKACNMPESLKTNLHRNKDLWGTLRGTPSTAERLVQIHRQPDFPVDFR